MNIRVILYTIILIFTACNNKESQQQLALELKQILKADDINIIDNDTLLITAKTSIEKTENGNLLLTSLAYNIIAEKYKPNELDINKPVKIRLIDNLLSYERIEKVNTILRFNQVFEKGKNILNLIINETNGANNENIEIQKFQSLKFQSSNDR